MGLGSLERVRERPFGKARNGSCLGTCTRSPPGVVSVETLWASGASTTGLCRLETRSFDSSPQ